MNKLKDDKAKEEFRKLLLNKRTIQISKMPHDTIFSNIPSKENCVYSINKQKDDSLIIYGDVDSKEDILNKSLNAALYITGDVKAKSFNIINGDVFIEKSLTTEGDVIIEGSLFVVGPIKVGGNLIVKGSIMTTSPVTVFNNVEVQGCTAVVGDLTSENNSILISGVCYVTGKIDAYSNVVFYPGSEESIIVGDGEPKEPEIEAPKLGNIEGINFYGDGKIVSKARVTTASDEYIKETPGMCLIKEIKL